MKQFISLLLIAGSFFSCHAEDEKIVIVVKIENSDIRKLYFTDAYQWEVLLDSAVGGPEFQFVIQRKTLPNSLYSISYINSEGKIRKLNFDNRILSPDSTKYVMDAFIPDSDTIRINGDLKKSAFYTIEGGEETKALYATQMMNFGYMSPDRTQRLKQLEAYNTIIKRYPNSNYLLSLLYVNKAAIRKEEMERLLSYFSENVLQGRVGKEMKAYAEKKVKASALPHLSLEDEKGRLLPILDSTPKMNVLIMWASWCATCRMEIPELKSLYEKYNDNGVKFISISIDESHEQWKHALSVEKMA